MKPVNQTLLGWKDWGFGWRWAWRGVAMKEAFVDRWESCLLETTLLATRTLMAGARAEMAVTPQMLVPAAIR